MVFFLVACQPVTPASFSATETPFVTVQPKPTYTIVSTIPATPPPTVLELDGAEVQPGFSLIKYAEVPRPTAFAFDGQGRMYVASQDGHIYLVTDDNADGRADRSSIFASGYIFPLGVAVHTPSGDVYISHQGVISVLSDMDKDDKADKERVFVGDLPFGKHQNDHLEFGLDGWLYVGVGSTCDACDDLNPNAATILRFNVETGEREVFATGLRTPLILPFILKRENCSPPTTDGMTWAWRNRMKN